MYDSVYSNTITYPATVKNEFTKLQAGGANCSELTTQKNQGAVPVTSFKVHSKPIVEPASTSYDDDIKPLNVLVFGPTGAGKSTIINHLTNNSANLPIGHELESCTSDIIPVSIKHKGRIITFLDTPGFDDSDKTPAEHLVLLMARLDEMHKLFKGRPHIHGVFYIHRITDNKMTKSAKMSIRTFQKLLGDHVFKNLVFVTNMWGTPPKDNHVRFEQSLIQKDEYFGAAVKKGARAGAAYRIYEDATRVQVQDVLLDAFLMNDPEVLQIQQELAASEVVEISSTEAGKVIREELKLATYDLQKRLGDLEQQLELVPSVEKEEQEEMLADIKGLKADLNKLKDQDSLLDADTTFLRKAIPGVMARVWAGTSAAVVANQVSGIEVDSTAAEVIVSLVGVAGGLAVGLGVLIMYARWRGFAKRK